MISFKNNKKNSKLSLKIIVVGILISSSLSESSFANGGPAPKYQGSWQNISSSLDEDSEVEQRYDGVESRLVDNYELFGAVGQSVSIYIKGNPSGESGGLCDPVGLVYDDDENNPLAVVASDDDSGRGSDDDSYDGFTCSGDDFFDTFFTVDNWDQSYRIQVSSIGIIDLGGEEDLNSFNSGDYTLYVSVGNFGSNENSSVSAPWIGTQSISCPAPNPWVKEKLSFATNAKPVLISAENTIGKTVTQSSYDALKSAGVVFDTVSTKVSTATETLPIYGCKDKLLSGKLNQPIQFIAGGYTLQSDAHGYINTADLKWHDTNGVTLYTNTAAFMHTIKFTQTGKYVVVLTEQPDTSRGLIPTYGVRSIRFVININ
jgi:hypothetical protein